MSHLDVYHRQGRLGRHGVGHPHLELQHVRAEHLGADWIGLVLTHILNTVQDGNRSL